MLGALPCSKSLEFKPRAHCLLTFFPFPLLLSRIANALSLSLARARAALPARDVFQQHAPGTSPVERRGVDDSAAQSGGDDEVSVIVFVVFGRRLFFFFINVAILDCRSPLELRPARLFRTPCVSTRPLSKRGAAKGKLARRGGELNRGK
jgi:hypothetical protein